MRIVSGKYGGRRLEAPKGRDVRPTSDKIRGAVFNSLRSRGAVADAVVLDVFCGTGALGLEALSQGAAQCTFVDKAKESLLATRNNISALGVDSDAVRVLKKDGLKLGACAEDISPATLAFLDPPYHKNLISEVLPMLKDGGWLAEGAVVVCESEKAYCFDLSDMFSVLDERIYGDTKIIVLEVC